MACPCGANCEPRRLPKWLVAQIRQADAGILGVAGIITDGFCCPLCVRVLPKTCATLAHAPSEAVGGKGATFLCKACNSFLGSAYEAGADDYIAEMRAGAEGIKRRISLAHPTGPRLYMDAVFAGEGDHKPISAEPRGRNEEAEARFAAAKPEDGRLLLQFRFAGESNIKLAFLSWAHLLLFRELGYMYVFSEAGRAARSALLTGTITKLGPAFFLMRGAFRGETVPIATGIAMRVRAADDDSSVVGIAAEIGPAIVALPLAGDPLGEYARLIECLSDNSVILVVPLDEVFEGHTSVIGGIANYGLQNPEGIVHRIFAVTPDKARAEIASAKAPASRRPPMPIPPPPTGWPPPTLTLPPEPRIESWRDAAAAYLVSRGLSVESSDDIAAWIDAIRDVDRVAARHVQDMRDLFELGQDPRSRPPKGFSELSEMNEIAARLDPDARLVAGDFRAISHEGHYASHSVRLLYRGIDLVIGPHSRYETLVYAVKVALGGGDDTREVA